MKAILKSHLENRAGFGEKNLKNLNQIALPNESNIQVVFDLFFYDVWMHWFNLWFARFTLKFFYSSKSCGFTNINA